MKFYFLFELLFVSSCNQIKFFKIICGCGGMADTMNNDTKAILIRRNAELLSDVMKHDL